MTIVNGFDSIQLEGDVVSRVVLPRHPDDNAADIYFESGKMVSAHFDMSDDLEQTRRIRLVTYDPVTRRPEIAVWQHGNDNSILGANVVAVVDGSLCDPRERLCVTCSALRRRIHSRVGPTYAQLESGYPRGRPAED